MMAIRWKFVHECGTLTVIRISERKYSFIVNFIGEKENPFESMVWQNRPSLFSFVN